MFDATATQRLLELFNVPRTERDPRWIEAFFEAAWNASVSIPKPPHFDGPDGLPYYRLNVPRSGERHEAQSLSNVARVCLDRNAGAAFFASADDADSSPEYVISMGTLDSLLRYDTHEGDPIDLEETVSSGASGTRIVETSEGTEQLIATPSPEFLPPYVAKALHRYMLEIWGIADPRVQLLVNGDMRPSRNLVIGRKRSEFPSDANMDDELAVLFWFLPPHRAIILMPEGWHAREMTRLSDLF
jgi:hypothetical protein